ncbi:hypothetical protein TRAPUB_4049 [Trametes pubescens]|uniref:DUF6535 domain-containing protein n=1 Tax=Trametes pubescens TaxID=154538 RepID=A0A1M2VC65_TRAPU|nr:hypothetical protein TRAPUB_4049 [Trametes pubescens]
MAKQWLNEYASGISSESEGGTSRQTARLRQYRLNNLIKWHVGNIINSIPVLLQVSVALFLAGLLVLLWTLHPAVAVVASVLASVLGVFTLSIVLLPSVKSGCAYLSPQSVALYYVLRRAPSLLGVSLSKILVPLTMYLLGRPQILGISTRKLANALWEWEPVKAPTWHGIEQSMVSEGSQSLDADIISTAYDIAMNPDLLATAAICLSELEPNIHVINCVERLQVIDESHFGVSPSPYVCAVVSATGSVIYDLWADSLLCHSTSEVQKITAHHHTDRHPISDLDDRLFRHFLWAERHLSGFEQGAVERVLLGLSLAACHVEEMSINTKTAHKIRSKFSPRNVRYAAAAAYQRISEGPAPDIQHLDRFCVYMGATVIVLECILASQDVPQDDLGILVHPYADHTLLHLIGVLRHANEEDLAKSDQFWMYFFVLQLSNLVNIVTEKHGALPAIRTLFPQDRISALEHAVAAAQGVIRRWSQSENAYWHWFHNRAGYRETLEDKLAHLRAIRPESRSGSALQEAPPSTTSLYPTLPSAPVPGEPPATSAPVERAPSSPVETAVPAAVELASGGDKLSTSTQTLDPSSHAPVAVEYLGHATPRPSSHHGVFSDEIHASQRCMHGGIIPAPVLVESSPASVPVELPGSISAAPPTPFLASEPPASLSVERHASPQLSSHHSASTEPHVSPL